MFRVTALMVGVGLCGLAANDPVRAVTSQAERIGNRLSPAFYKGYVYWIGRDGGDGAVTIYAPDGQLAYRIDSDNRPVYSIAVDTDGTVALAWGQWNSKEDGGIDFRDKYGQLVRTIRTGRYLPVQISFGEDHSVWSFGCQFDGATREDQKGMTVRHYLPDGEEAGAYLPRSLFPRGLTPGAASWHGLSSVFVAHDRVGMWAQSGETGKQTEWVELDLNGNLLGRWRLDQYAQETRITRIALTSDGHVFLQTNDPEKRTIKLYTLDRPSSTWRVVESPPSGWLESADGNLLVFSDAALGPMHIRWHQHP